MNKVQGITETAHAQPKLQGQFIFILLLLSLILLVTNIEI